MVSKTAELIVSITADTKGLDKGIKSSEKTFMGFNKTALKVAAGVGAFGAAAVVAGKQIYAMGKRGAAVTQTADSFEYLSDKLGLPKDLLEKLQEESKGTITDFKLMSSTATLLAGTSDELGLALGKSTPELMRIAKAANKLNPSLGTTSHMYESIALGIKRASPLILDNLGLTIKIGDANETMAKELGKSVEALTAEEKQMALLNATLEAGDKLIDQVGGTTDSATDSFAQAETAIQNVKDGLSQLVLVGIEPAVTGFAALVQGAIDHRDAYEELDGALDTGLITLDDHNQLQWDMIDGIKDTNDVLDILTEKEEERNERLGITEEMSQKLIDKIIELDGAYDNQRIAAELLRLEMDRGIERLDLYRQAEEEAETATWNFGTAIGEAYKGIDGLTGILQNQYMNALKTATDGVFGLERAKFLFTIATTNTTEAQRLENIKTLAAIDRMEKLEQAVKDGTIAQEDLYAAIMDDGVVSLEEFNRLMGISADVSNEADIKFRAAGAGVDVLETQMREAKNEAYLLKDGLIGASGNYAATFTTRYVTEGVYAPEKRYTPRTPAPYVPPPTPYIPPGDLPPGAGGGYNQFQRGGSFIVPSGYPNDAFPIYVSSGEHVEVTPRSKVGREKSQPNITNILNIHTNAPVESDVPDLLLLRAWASG